MDKPKNNVKPFIKWAGGKRGLIDTFEEKGFFPKEFNNYFEPMLGGGAVFLHVAQNYDVDRCFLADVNPDLIDIYRTVKENVDDLIEELKGIKDDYSKASDQEQFYYERRDEFNVLKLGRDQFGSRKPALFIFLNKTCFNGLYRVNQSGEFNVPYGRYKNPRILDEENLLDMSELLKKDDLSVADFEVAVKDASEGDFVYFDPPYVPLSDTSAFTSYSKEDFGLEEQKRLAKVVSELAERGCYVMESNSSSPLITDDIYEEYENLKIHYVEAPRYISCKADGRKPVKEVVIINYKPDPKKKKLSFYK